MKGVRGMYYVGMGLSMAVGIWHFFVPAMFQWYSYIPAEYENLIVGIDWTNYCFSVLLTGMSLLLIVYGKRIFMGSGELLVFYGFLVFVWLNRVAIALVRPWSLEPIAWVGYAQFGGAILILALQLVPLILLIARRKTAQDAPRG